MLDFLGTVATAALIVFVISALLVFMEAPRSAKLVLAGLLGLWVGVAAAGSAAGWAAIARPFPVMGIFVATPLVVAAIATASPAARRAMLSLPLQLLVGLNIGRVFAVLFLLLAAEGRLSGPFPYSAGWGDIITGAVALPLALSVARSQKPPVGAIRLWNIFGTLDLFAAVGLGITSAAGSPLQLIHAGAGSEAMQYLPFCLVPTVLVPFYLITHAIIAAQLSALRAVPSARARALANA